MVIEGCMLHKLAEQENTKKRRGERAGSGTDGVIVKVLEILVSLVYVVYDATTKDPPRVGHDGARSRDMLCGGHSHLSRMSHSLQIWKT